MSLLDLHTTARALLSFEGTRLTRRCLADHLPSVSAFPFALDSFLVHRFHRFLTVGPPPHSAAFHLLQNTSSRRWELAKFCRVPADRLAAGRGDCRPRRTAGMQSDRIHGPRERLSRPERAGINLRARDKLELALKLSRGARNVEGRRLRERRSGIFEQPTGALPSELLCRPKMLIPALRVTLVFATIAKVFQPLLPQPVTVSATKLPRGICSLSARGLETTCTDEPALDRSCWTQTLYAKSKIRARLLSRYLDRIRNGPPASDNRLWTVAEQAVGPIEGQKVD